MKGRRIARMMAVLACGCLAAAVGGCLLPVASIGGRVVIDILVDVLLEGA